MKRKRRWKRWLLGILAFSLLCSGVVVSLCFTRLHFPQQMFPTLARLQWQADQEWPSQGIRPQIVGHRGAGLVSTKAGLLIGNTANAIQTGIDAGVDWIEIDIRRSSDGQLVLFHDQSIAVRTNGTGNVAQLTMAQLQAVELYLEPPERILSLDAMFDQFGGRQINWILDIKVKGIAEEVLTWLNERIAKAEISPDQVVIFGTDEILAEYIDSGFSLSCTVLWSNYENRYQVLVAPWRIIERCRQLHCTRLVLPVIFASDQLVKTASSQGIETWVYGTDDRGDFQYLTEIGVSGFIVDHPAAAVEFFSPSGAASVSSSQ